MARYIAFAVVFTLVASTTGIVLTRYFSTRQELEASARHFAGLVRVPLVQIALMYGKSGHQGPVQNWVTQLLLLNRDVEKLEVVLLNGSLVFSASRNRVEAWPLNGPMPSIEDDHLIVAIQSQTQTSDRVRVDGQTVYRVVVPGIEESQSYNMSLVATYGYDRVDEQLIRGAAFLALALALGLVVATQVSTSLARGITRNLADLQRGVRRIRAGRLTERVDIDSGDEIEELADAFNDMTENLQQTIGRLRQANVELQALDQVKVDLVANVSHELRTPLTALKGFLELLDEGELGELGGDAHRAVTVCRRNVDRLALRVEDLVQLSQMEKAWPEQLSYEPIDVTELISMICEIYEVRIDAKNQTLTLDSPPDPPQIIGNDEQIERVVINLLDNAMKFTPENGTISISVEECDHENREGVLIRVADSGVGIPSSELVRIFDRFHQVDPSIRRRYGGMGLGLSLVHHIVESHGGVVWAESESGQGATFFVWLPCRPEDEAGEGGRESKSDTLLGR
jgi:signal transduction histidine kinase